MKKRHLDNLYNNVFKDEKSVLALSVPIALMNLNQEKNSFTLCLINTTKKGKIEWHI